MIKILDTEKKNVLGLKIKGRINKEDYDDVLPVANKMIQENDKVRCLVDISEMESFEPEVFWKDLEYSLKHTDDFDKIAIVGTSTYLNALLNFSIPFTSAQVKSFKENEIIKASEWVVS